MENSIICFANDNMAILLANTILLIEIVGAKISYMKEENSYVCNVSLQIVYWMEIEFEEEKNRSNKIRLKIKK